MNNEVNQIKIKIQENISLLKNASGLKPITKENKTHKSYIQSELTI